jgi:hypothetical protein
MDGPNDFIAVIMLINEAIIFGARSGRVEISGAFSGRGILQLPDAATAKGGLVLVGGCRHLVEP